MNDVRAFGKHIGMSAQKMRLVIDLVRGRRAAEALTMLQFMSQAAAKPVAKVLATAIANADENFGLDRDDLYIAHASVDEGPTRKWRRFGARGRFKPILRRSSHITIVLKEREGAVA